MSSEPTLNRTALYGDHLAANGRMVPFAGWSMPVQYEGVLSEVRAVRNNVGIFDVSHMGRLRIEGLKCGQLLEQVLTFPVQSLNHGRARYGFLLTPEGGVIDDVIVYQQSADDGARGQYTLICNASNRETVISWINENIADSPDILVTDFTGESVMIALQGPQAGAIVDDICVGEQKPSTMRPFSSISQSMKLQNLDSVVDVFIGRTGYTGEDGFEIVADAKFGSALWTTLQIRGAAPCGLGARDVLRLEAGLRLHGSDMDTSKSPLEAGLDRFVNMQSHEFIGRKALKIQETTGLDNILVGFRLLGPGIPRHEHVLLKESKQIGEVTSGTYSPTLDTGIGMGYVSMEYSTPGDHINIDIRGRIVEAEIVELPFYHRQK